jgi:hypothetical protein
MVIELDEEQRAVLGELVRSRLSNLSSEIRHTDSPPVRQGLRDEREVLRDLVVLLAPAEEAVG